MKISLKVSQYEFDILRKTNKQLSSFNRRLPSTTRNSLSQVLYIYITHFTKTKLRSTRPILEKGYNCNLDKLLNVATKYLVIERKNLITHSDLQK
jgi:hypothetical protein